MRNAKSISRLKFPGTGGTGSVLLYVLWILILISALAFQLSLETRASSLSQAAFSKQIRKQMQIDSAIQFAAFRIRTHGWQNREFSFELNGQQIKLSIFNEAGFVSLYATESPLLENIFKRVGLGRDDAVNLIKTIEDEELPRRFNSFSELMGFSGIDRELLHRLVPLVSILREDLINPMYSPPRVLMQFNRVDRYRVQQLAGTTDPVEINQLRTEIVESLRQQNNELSENDSEYFRVIIEIDGQLHRVFLKQRRRQAGFITVLVETAQTLDSDKLN